MLSNDWTTTADLAYRAHVCGCADCKRVANRAVERLRLTLMFMRAYEAFNDTAELYPKPLRRQLSFTQRTMFLESSAFCAAVGVSSSD